jgi:hypothetical protein
MKKLVALAGLLVLGGSLAIMLASCGSEGSSSPALPQEPTQTNPNPVLNADGSSPARLSGDGRYFGYIRAASADPPTISFDVAQFFYGKAVQRAAEEDGAVRPGEPVSNDHYERNTIAKTSPLELTRDARVTAAWPASFLMKHVTRRSYDECEAAYRRAGACTQVPLSLATFFAATRSLDVRYGIPVWVTIRDGLVVRIDEQYFP